MHKLVKVISIFLFTTLIKCMPDELVICVQELEAKPCQQPAYYGLFKDQELFDVKTESVQILDAKTNRKTESLRVPGKYRLHFGNMRVKEDMDFIISDVKLELDVGGFGRLNAMPDCDTRSYQVNVDGERNPFCRYCDLCNVTKEIEDTLLEHKVLPNLGAERFNDYGCESLKRGRSYNFWRTLDLPETSKFQEEFGGKLDRDVENALLTGVGEMHIQVRLITTKTTAQSNYSHESGACVLNCARNTIRPQDLARRACLSAPWLPGCISPECISSCVVSQSSSTMQQYTETCKNKEIPDYSSDYQLAGCFNVYLKYDAKYVQHDEVRTCPPKHDSCKGEPNYCCGCKDCIQFGFDCSEGCTNVPKDICNGRRSGRR